MDVSVIIVNYNSFNLLKQCLDSIFKFTFDIQFELIVIDNNSEKFNEDSIRELNDKIIVIRNKKNLGFGHANNQGLAIAKGKYVLFLNNDTIFFENTLKEVYLFAEKVTYPVIVGCKLLNIDKTLQHSVFDFPSLLNVFTSNFFLYALFPRSKYFNKYHLMNNKINYTAEVDVVIGAFLFCNTQKIKEINGFDIRFFFYNDETDLCYRHRKNGGKIFYFPNVSVIHLGGGSARRKSWFANKHRSISTIKYFQKHFPRMKLLIAVLIHFTGILIRIPVFLVLGLITVNKDLILRSYYYARLLFLYPSNQF